MDPFSVKRPTLHALIATPSGIAVISEEKKSSWLMCITTFQRVENKTEKVMQRLVVREACVVGMSELSRRDNRTDTNESEEKSSSSPSQQHTYGKVRAQRSMWRFELRLKHKESKQVHLCPRAEDAVGGEHIHSTVLPQCFCISLLCPLKNEISSLHGPPQALR